MGLLKMIIGVATSLVMLEQAKIVHRDIACRNFLLTKSMEPKLSDFGRARTMQASKDYYRATNQTEIPIRWTSPEAVSRQQYSTASDAYAFGVTMWEILTLGRVPFANLTNKVSGECE
jgi:serine/threonine protein kinase